MLATWHYQFHHTLFRYHNLKLTAALYNAFLSQILRKSDAFIARNYDIYARFFGVAFWLLSINEHAPISCALATMFILMSRYIYHTVVDTYAY